MTKDIITVALLIPFAMASLIAEWLGFGKEGQTLAYELSTTLVILVLAIAMLTEVKGKRVYIWLGMVFLAGMNPVNLIFSDLKLTLPVILISYAMAFIGVFLYRRMK